MKATAIVRAAHADGIDLPITATGSIRAKGPAAAVAKWAPVLASNKPAIVDELLSRLEPGHVGDWEERAAHLEYDAGLPRTWAEPFARLLCSGPPRDFDPARWQRIVDGGLKFADQWGAKAHALGWKLDEVIGMDPIAPAAQHDRKGLALLLERGARVVAIDYDGADVLTAQGSKQRFYRNVEASAEGAK